MSKEIDLKDLISQLSNLSILVSEMGAEVGFLEGVRQLGSFDPVPKSQEQISKEKEIRYEIELMEKLKQEIAEKLGIKEEVKDVTTVDFIDFLMINYKRSVNDEFVRINDPFTPLEKATPEMIRNSSLL